MINIIIIK